MKEKQMKKQNGITMVSLVVYLTSFFVIAGIIGIITTYFYHNINFMSSNVGSVADYNKFNTNFSKITKTSGVKIIQYENTSFADRGIDGSDAKTGNNNGILEDFITFEMPDGTTNTFLLQDNILYLNQVKLCEDVNEFQIWTESSDKVTVAVEISISGKNYTNKYVLNGMSSITPNSENHRLSENAQGIKVGDYVTYTPPSRSAYTVQADYSGADNDINISQVYNKWRVLNLYSDGSMDLVADITSSGGNIQFFGDLGYNNCVFILNDVCKYLYSYEEKGITARSMNIEDVESHYNQIGINTKNDYIRNYINDLNVIGTRVTKNVAQNSVTYIDQKYIRNKGTFSVYPDIFKHEIGSGIDTTTVRTSGISSSDPYYSSLRPDDAEWVTLAHSVTMQQSQYYLSNSQNCFDNTNIYNIIFGYNLKYYLASRCCICSYTEGGFGLHFIAGTDFGAFYIFSTKITNLLCGGTIRPLVHIPASVTVNKNAGTSSSPHTLTIP